MKYILPNFFVTRATKRKYIKPMFASIPQIMMIVGSASPAITKIFSRLFLSPPFNLVTNSLLCSRLVSIKRVITLSIFPSFLRISLTAKGCTFTTCNTPLFCLLISFASRFTYLVSLTFLIGKNIFFDARFTPRMQTAFIARRLVEFKKRFVLLASRTLFCLNGLRHGSFSFPESPCLEPVAVRPVIGSLNSIFNCGGNQELKCAFF